MTGSNNNILVLIQLIGGNDGLSTLVPLAYYKELNIHRKNILIPENLLLKTTDNIGFHPHTLEMYNLYKEGELCVVNNIGYPQPNRSHFRSMDIWNSGSPSNEQWNTGWLGRLLDLYHEDYPNEYPNELFPDPLAITVGNIVSDTCQGKSYNYSHVIDNLNAFTEINKCSIGTVNNNQYTTLLNYLNSTIGLTNSYTQQIEKAAAKGKSNLHYPDKNNLAQELKIVAKLISGGLKTKIYVLSMGGFDTHAYQVGKTDTLQGMHAYLLKFFSEAIDVFIKDLKSLGCYNRVCIASYSEFGRQIKSNSALGTDHGDATSIYLFGQHFKNKLIGAMPVIPSEIEAQKGLDMTIDFRDLYSSLLSEWFSVSFEKMAALFKTKPMKYNIFNSN